ncbi:MAG: hypothetical protein M5U19_10980 [Microthrixaceae bacterium]|nr:hypothetical protein [Microthrixaceae bacterium]
MDLCPSTWDATRRGKKQQKWAAATARRRKPRRFTEEPERMRTGMWVDPGVTTLGEYLTEWLAAMESNVVDTTFRSVRAVDAQLGGAEARVLCA